ncbi:pathogenesis-related protein 1-like [Iris pallida]|uniref:Pathogenesis-related protein 1-like n=1 Tax=Iris pallida TaxID=29817 RepID=A0AAX6GV50_IRIPA|nr:pathogenesis-related protein 1-like [Iris pallida]
MLCHEIQSPVAPSRLFKASMVDWHNLGPKVMPEMIASAATVSGDGSAGSIRQINFTSAMPYTYMKDRLDLIDHGQKECKYTLVEGGELGKKFETASIHFKFMPAGDGSAVKVVATGKSVPGAAVEKDQAEAKESVTALIKAAEAYLLSNLAAYAK